MQRRRARVATIDYDFDSVVIDLGAAEELVGFRLAVRQLQRQRLAAVDNNAQAVSIEVVARRDRAAQPGRAILRSEERRVGKECVVRIDLGGRRSIKQKKRKHQTETL